MLLQFLAPELATAHVLVIGTYRDGDLPSNHPLRHTLGNVACQPGSDSGLHYIAHLLQHLHQEFHVFDLLALGRKRASGQSAPGHLSGDPGNAGGLLDLQARNAYKQRLQALQQDMEEAQRCNDVGRSDCLRCPLRKLPCQAEARPTSGVGSPVGQA